MKNIHDIDSNLELISRECIKINLDVKDIKILIANLTEIFRDYIKIKQVVNSTPIRQIIFDDDETKLEKKDGQQDKFGAEIKNIREIFHNEIQSEMKKNSLEINKTQKQLQEWKQKLQKHFITKTNSIDEKIFIIQQSIKNDIVVLGQPLVIGDKDKEKQKQKERERRVSLYQGQKFQDKSWFDKFFSTEKDKNFSLKEWLDEDCFYIPNLIQIGDTITTKDFSYIFSKKKLVGQSSFCVTFSKIGWRVALGVIDTENKKKNSLSSFNQNCLWCWNDGDLYISGKLSIRGKGYSVGQSVTVAINTHSGIIQWKVGTDAKHIAYSELLTNHSITWVPFIYLYSRLDSVIISG